MERLFYHFNRQRGLFKLHAVFILECCFRCPSHMARRKTLVLSLTPCLPMQKRMGRGYKILLKTIESHYHLGSFFLNMPRTDGRIFFAQSSRCIAVAVASPCQKIVNAKAISPSYHDNITTNPDAKSRPRKITMPSLVGPLFGCRSVEKARGTIL